MYKVEAIVREEKLEDVKEALVAEDIRGMTISQVMGCGVQMGFTELVRGNEIAVNMIPKIKFEILVSNEHWRDKAIEAIRVAAWTGEPGDGKIFAYSVDTAVRIRTAERDVEAVTPSPEGRDHNRRQKNTTKLNEK
jgi:nitrogen regulatory protein P-II 1